LSLDGRTGELFVTDEEAIQRTISTYAEAGSRRDLDRALATFVPDATWEFAGHPEHKHTGVVAIRRSMEQLVSTTEYLVQMNSPAVIHVDGDWATARSVIRESGKVRERDEYLDVLGIYEDVLVRTSQAWLFKSRIFTMIGAAKMPIQNGPVL
jgi:ketosteroid isomerase-like protein